MISESNLITNIIQHLNEIHRFTITRVCVRARYNVRVLINICAPIRKFS